jgi:large repetitive protein
MRKCLVFLFTCTFSVSLLSTINPSQAVATSTTLTTCKSLKSSVQYLAKDGNCNERIYESSTWYQIGAVPKGTPGSKTISIDTCQSKFRKDLILLRSKCNTKTQVTTTWHRPLGPPDAPSILTITAGALGTATVIAKGPINNGGARITSFSLSANPTKIEGKTERVSSTYKPNSLGEIKISGLIPGDNYIFTLVAHNAVGASASSQASAPFLAPTVPASPTITAVIATGTNSALITYTAPTFDGGSPITSYTATSFPSGIKATAYRSTAGTIEVSGLVSSTSYTFTIVANNFAGSSLPSTISATITTFSPPPPPPAPAVEAPAPTLAAPAFTLSSSSETQTANIVATGFTISSTGGLIASFAINATPAGMSFSTSTGALTGTPTSIAVATTYTVTATNASGSATATFDLTVLAPLSTDATLTTASTVKGQAVLLLGTPSATLASATAGSVTISSTQAADTSNTGSYITAFSKTNSGATISRIVKYASGASYTGFATDSVYNGTAAITAGDFFIVKVVAVDESAILYYNIIAKFLPTFSAWANLSKPALAGDFVLTAPVVTGSLAGVFTYSSGTTGVITVSSATAHVVSSGTSVITATFTPTNTAAYSSANTTMTITVTTGDYTVGMDGPGGGKVFYVSTSTFLCGETLNTYCKFLESAPNGWNLGSDPQKIWAVTDWQKVTTAGLISDGSADNTSTGIGLGLKNSIAIVNQGNNSTTAAGLARAYAGGSLSDWYLPSTSELLQMCKWARAVAWTSDVTVCSGGTINLGTGNGMGAAGFTESRYWSSSQQGANTAWSQHFDTGGSQSAFSKATATYYMRPIRAFGSLLPLFTLSSASETRTVNIAATGFTVTSKGGAIVSFAIDAIPAGMSFNTTTGALTGTPNTVAGVTTYTVTATNSSGTSTATFALKVTGSPAKVAITRASVGTATALAFTTQPQITIQDSGSNTVIASSAIVTASISSGGTLIGTTTAAASSGVATFSNLGVSGTVGTSYMVTYTAVGLTVATVSITVTAYAIGSIGPGGGKIFYISEAGFNCGSGFTRTGSPTGGLCRYLEAATSAISPSWTDATTVWSSNTIKLIGGTTSEVGSGWKNTLRMIDQNPDPNAGTVAKAFAGGGLTDWYLPSKDELLELYSRKNLVGEFVANSYYWSSTEYNSGNAWLKDFSGSSYSQAIKSATGYYVRPIRAF